MIKKIKNKIKIILKAHAVCLSLALPSSRAEIPGDFFKKIEMEERVCQE